MSNAINRRNFLKLGCAALGGSVLACGGLSFVAVREPEIEMTQNSSGGGSTMNKILVAYASKSGTTVDVAQAIGKSLGAKGAAVDVLPIKSIKSLDGYRAFVVGSGIRMGSWLPEAVDFVKKNQAQLNQAPVVFFTVHMLNRDDSETSRQGRAAYTAPVRQVVNPKAEAFFAGRMDFSKLSFLESMISKAMKAKEEDLRDWSKIRAWGESMSTALGTM